MKPGAQLLNQETLSRRLRFIASLYTNRLAQQLSFAGINRYFDVLLILSSNPAPVTQNKLADLMNLDKSRMVAIINYLQQNGYVTVERNPADRREHLIKLSEKGLEIIPEIKIAVKNNNEKLSCSLTDADICTCLRTLSIIEGNLKKSV
jgi:DNA-binding MarR family transcriptional regulator